MATLAPRDAVPVRLVFGAPGQPRSVILPFGREVSLAILRRGEAVLVVLDTARPLNLLALRADPVFAGMQARTVPGGTVLSLGIAEPGSIIASRRDGAWALTADLPAAVPDRAMPVAPSALVLEAGTEGGLPRLLIHAADPGGVVAIADPESGLPLLVGTLRSPGGGMLHPRRLPEADLLPTSAGVAALSRSDRFALRSVPTGFVAASSGGVALALDPAVTTAAPPRTMTRLFDVPDLPASALLRRLQAERSAMRDAPPLSRLPLRRSTAETLMALGLPQEAQATLAQARAEDPAAERDPSLLALAAAAALVAGRPAEAEALDRSDLPERDETLFWRSWLAAQRGEAVAAAPGLAATVPLVLAYPEALRARLLAPVAEVLASARDAAALRQLVQGAGPRDELALARATLAELEGRVEDALVGYAEAARGRDRLARAQALRRGVELRLAQDAITPAAAADALEAALFAWRGDGEEIAARVRIAELRVASGDGSGAFALLRETEALFPEQAETLRPAMQHAFLAALVQEAPLAAAALHGAHPNLLPTSARGDDALLGLAERLAAFEMPDRAAALLRPLIDRAMPGSVRRAEIGLRLAQMLFAEGDALETLATLQASTAEALPADLAHERTILAARAEARRGQRDAAVASLEGLGAHGAEALAELLTEARDWAGAARAQALHLRASMPPAPAALEEAQARAVLRQAALLGLAGDQLALAALASEFAPRLAGGRLSEPFAALTAGPVQGLADLPRLQRELNLFRSLPGRLEPLRAASLGAR
jgi:hypothetical protein